MNRRNRTLVVLLVAVAVASGASYFVYRAVMSIPVREVEVKSYHVAVATKALPVGTMVSPSDVKLVPWPASSPVAGGYSKVEEVVNRGLIAPVVENEPLTSTKLAAIEAGAGLPPTIATGMRAISVKVNEVIGVAGFVVPGTRVDVVVTIGRREDSVSRAVAADVKWPFIGELFGGTQRFTPRVQVVASPKLKNIEIPNEDARAVDLEDSNLFALNRFPGYDRFEDSTRVTYGGEWALTLPGFTINTVIGQSYRLNSRPTIFYDGTGLSDRWSDFVGRTELRFRDLVSVIHRYRLDKDNFAVRRNEIDAVVGSRATYAQIGYLRLDRNIFPAIEDLQDREEARVAGRVQFARFWSAFGSAVIDLTNRREDPLSTASGFDPVRHRVGFQYEDDCVRLGFAWQRFYNNTGDARSGNSYSLTLAFTNLGR